MFVSSTGDCRRWQRAGYELFQDVNSYAKAFGELVESRRHTPSLPADEVAALIARNANIAILDVRRFDEYATMNIPGSVSVPGAELVLRAGRRRAGSRDDHHRELRRPHPIDHRRPVADQRRRSEQGAGAEKRDDRLDARETAISSMAPTGAAASACSRARKPMPAKSPIAPASGISARRKRGRSQAQTHRTLYRFDVRASEDYAAGHIAGFRHYPGGQLVQEIDMAAPVRGARILLTDDMAVRADMTASWLAQMGWETYVLDGGYDGALEVGPPRSFAEARSVPSLPASL